jgi:membrane protein YqaA with SNARE-associated domain
MMAKGKTRKANKLERRKSPWQLAEILPHLKMLGMIAVFYLATNAALPFVLSLHGFGYVGAFVISLVSSASIILPTPGFIAIFELGRHMDPLLLGIAAGIGSTIGELTAYYAGKVEQEKLKKTKIYKSHRDALLKYGPVAMFVLAVLPNPAFDIAGIAAGAIDMPLWQYLLSVGSAKIIKYTVLAYSGLLSIGFLK